MALLALASWVGLPAQESSPSSRAGSGRSRAEDDPLDALCQRIQQELTAKDLVAARRLLAELDRQVSESGDTYLLAMVPFWTGQILAAEGRTSDAVRSYEAGLTIARRQPVESAAAPLFHLLVEQAMLMSISGRAEDSVARAREALAIAMRFGGGEARRDWRSRADMTLGYSLLTARVPGEAISCFERSLDSLRELGMGESIGAGKILLFMSRARLDLGEPARAQGLADESYRIFMQACGPDSELVAVAAARQSDCHRPLGRYRQALEKAEQALAVYLRLGNRGELLATTLNNVGAMLFDLGRYAEALPRFDAAWRIWSEMHQGMHRDVAMALESAGNCLRQLGRADEAVAKQEAAMAIRRRVLAEDDEHIAIGLDCLALDLLEARRYREARTVSEQALALATRLHGRLNALTATCHHNLALVLHELGEDAAALSQVRESLAIRRSIFSPLHPHVVTCEAQIGALLLRAGKRVEAVSSLERVIAAEREISGPQLAVALCNLGALVGTVQGDHARAKPLLCEALDLLERSRKAMGGSGFALQASYGDTLARYGCLENLVNARLALNEREDAFSDLERWHGRVLLDLLARASVDPLELLETRARAAGDAALERSVAAQRAAYESASHALDTLRSRRIAGRGEGPELQQELTRAEARLRELELEGSSLAAGVVPQASPVSAADVQQALGRDERLVAFVLGGVFAERPLSFVFVLGPKGTPTLLAPLDTSEAQVADLVRRFHAELALPAGDPDRGGRKAGAAASRPTSRPAAADELFRLLFPKACWEAVRGAKRLIVLPHGPLHRLPLEALLTRPAGGAEPPRYWLDEGPPIVYAASASTWLASKRRVAERAASRPAALEIVLVADPEFQAAAGATPSPQALLARLRRGALNRDGGRLPALPGARKEAVAIARIYGEGNSKTLLGPEATERGLFDVAGTARILQIATHYLSDDQVPGGGALALAEPGAPRAGDDGYLTLTDLIVRWRDRLARCDLVVLSACETHLGALARDEGMLAIPWGFLHAGAPAVISTLWRVDDDSASQLMIELHGALRSGLGTAEALQRARKAVRARRPEPYHWAPFIVFGNPR